MELTFDRLTKEYGAKIAVDRVSAALGPGVHGLLGANGAGKTTLMRMACGVLRPTSGEVRFDGAPIERMGGDYRALLGYLPQDFGYYPEFTALDNVAMPLWIRREDQEASREEARRMLEAVGLSHRLQHLPSQLSGGERQRAFIAMTLAQDTDLIVLDEPTTYLDIRACHETMELIRRLNEEAGKTIVMVIHDLDLALRYSDRLLVMERGRAAAAGTVEEVLATGAIERAFGVSIRPHEAAEGRAYTLFPA